MHLHDASYVPNPYIYSVAIELDPRLLDFHPIIEIQATRQLVIPRRLHSILIP